MDQVLGMMLYPHTLTPNRFPAVLGVLFEDEAHPYSVGVDAEWPSDGGHLFL